MQKPAEVTALALCGQVECLQVADTVDADLVGIAELAQVVVADIVAPVVGLDIVADLVAEVAKCQ